MTPMIACISLNVFQALFEYSCPLNVPIANNDVILSLMRSMPPTYKSFISFVGQQPNIVLWNFYCNLKFDEIHQLKVWLHLVLTLMFGC